MTQPAKNDRVVARSQFQEDLGTVMANRHVARCGWRLRPDYDNLRLFVDMWALDENRRCLDDDYHIVMDMEYYRNYPPGVTFLNPKNWSFDPSLDMAWFPKLGGARPPYTTLCFDPALKLEGQGYSTIQVFNNTMFLEYYFNGGDISTAKTWNPSRNTFFATLDILQKLLTRPCYEGRSQ